MRVTSVLRMSALLIASIPQLLRSQLVETRRPRPSLGVNASGQPLPAQPPVAVCSSGHSAFFERGLVDALTSGVVQASAQLVRLCLMPGPLHLPLYLFVGASDPAGATADNAKALATLLNPLAGNINVTINNSHQLGNGWYPQPNQPEAKTRLFVNYDVGGKYFSGAQIQSAPSRVDVFAFNADAALRVEFPATNLDDPEKMGIGFVQGGIGGSFGKDSTLQKLFGPEATGALGQYSASGGIDVPKLTFSVTLTGIIGFRTSLQNKTLVKVGFSYKPGDQ